MTQLIILPTPIVECYMARVRRVNPQDSVVEGRGERTVIGQRRSKAYAINECRNVGDCDFDDEGMISVRLKVFLPTHNLFAIGGYVGCCIRMC
jgi:hypothetical protein